MKTINQNNIIWKSSVFKSIILFTAYILLSGCEKSDTKSEKEAVISAIKQIHNISAQAKKKGDVDSFVNLFSEDGIYMWPGVPAIEGHNALRSWFKERLEKFSPKIFKTIEQIEVMDNWVFERGREIVQIKNRSTGKIKEVKGKYVNMFKKQKDNSWKIAWRIRNLDHPPLQN